jgi:DNA mismatch repair protein MLH3
MFNDPLTVDQCSSLVQRLAACAFPFQCAHGRPSMVPLVHLSGKSAFGSSSVEAGEEARDDLFGDLKRWERRRKQGDEGTTAKFWAS